MRIELKSIVEKKKTVLAAGQTLYRLVCSTGEVLSYYLKPGSAKIAKIDELEKGGRMLIDLKWCQIREGEEEPTNQ